MKKLITTTLNLYKNFLSGLLVILFGHACRFTPTCSEYAKGAVETHGVIVGTSLALRRVLSCNPLGSSGYDPVPERVGVQ